jgi:tRNA (cmo5U34)-methyltransferase
MSKDDLFRHGGVDADFQFSEQVAEVFDDMLARSVPNYGQVIEMIAQLLGRFLAPGDRVYDLGCSTGNTLLQLARRLESLDLRFIGLDSSPAMVHKASLKAEMYSKKERLAFQQGDITATPLEPAGAIICNYTLQFIRPLRRPEFLARVAGSLKPGGVLILSEKSISHDPVLNRAYIDFYLDFKRAQGYSELEIAAKREALENVLIPFSIEENRRLLSDAGFASVETFFQWFNFVSFVAVK